ncbi:MAG TPA: hypothetical protein VL968_11680 [Rhodocyclaceae bacterium]|jgi:hypothetical protein|nr:hypothetical protein [Rhodocyclaceae bacterium]
MQDERRTNTQVREIFVEAYDLLEPFFDPVNNWAGQGHEHLAFRALHERFPDLPPNQVLVLVTAAKRVFTTGNKPTPAA